MKIYLVRHAIATRSIVNNSNKNNSRKYYSDDRPLSKEGLVRLKSSLAGIQSIVKRPNTILTSPLSRAFETASIIANYLDCSKKVVASDLLLPNIDCDQVLSLIANNFKKGPTMLVGHEPDLSHLASNLLGHSNCRLEMKKGSICCIEYDFARRSGTLVFLIPPKTLRLLSVGAKQLISKD